MDTLKRVIHPIHKEGYPFIALAGAITVITSIFVDDVFWILAIITAWVIYFFRDPIRTVPQKDGLVVSPGDGVITKIEKASPPKELEMKDGTEMTRISVFLNVFNVHVNRIPVKGKVVRLYYFAGKFLNANLDKASEENERQSVWIKTDDDKDVAVSQIAGLIARRIVCDLENNQEVETGERFGIIRFGSRVDVYLPLGVEPQVSVGQLAVGGETIFADLSATDVQPAVGKQI